MVIMSKSVSPAIIISGVVLVVIASAVLVIMTNLRPTVPLYLSDGVFDARIAYTQSEREKGLEEVTGVGDHEALILAFPTSDKWKIWMKNMKIPIDIIWLDDAKKVVYTVKNAQPYGGASTVFEPKSDAKYVVEVQAGTVDAKTIKTGRTAVFDIKSEEIK